MTCTATPVEAIDASLLAGIDPGAALVDGSERAHTSEVEDFVKTVIARYGRHVDGTVAMRRPLIDLGVDVLALIDIVMDVEARFAIELDPDEILSWLTAADVVDTIGAALSS